MTSTCRQCANLFSRQFLRDFSWKQEKISSALIAVLLKKVAMPMRWAPPLAPNKVEQQCNSAWRRDESKSTLPWGCNISHHHCVQSGQIRFSLQVSDRGTSKLDLANLFSAFASHEKQMQEQNTTRTLAKLITFMRHIVCEAAVLRR
jgi:hypothetical protein